MPIKILMPALSPTMTEGNLAKWLKKAGDTIEAGDVIAEIETDKATMEMEAVDEGVLGKIVVPEGTNAVKVNSVIAILLEEGETEQDIKQETEDKQEKEPKQETSSQKTEEVPEKPDQPEEAPIKNTDTPQKMSATAQSDKIFASPLAKKIAANKGIDLTNIKGSGPRGRIVKNDVLNIDTKQIARIAEEYKSVPNSNVRKIIAERLLESKNTVPHFYLSIECIMDNLIDTREVINSTFEDKQQKISINDFIVLASAKALQDVPEANATWTEDAILYYNNVDVAIAVAIEGGLITPIIRNANQQNIMQLAANTKSLIAKARGNSLQPEEFQGGGFTISNLGMYGIKNFSAIINPPQSCILAVGESSKRPIIDNDDLKIATIMDVTLSCDHRVVDGAVGAKLLAAFKKYIESPALLLI